MTVTHHSTFANRRTRIYLYVVLLNWMSSLTCVYTDVFYLVIFIVWYSFLITWIRTSISSGLRSIGENWDCWGGGSFSLRPEGRKLRAIVGFLTNTNLLICSSTITACCRWHVYTLLFYVLFLTARYSGLITWIRAILLSVPLLQHGTEQIIKSLASFSICLLICPPVRAPTVATFVWFWWNFAQNFRIRKLRMLLPGVKIRWPIRLLCPQFFTP